MMQDVITAYKKAKKRLILTDYDGTLVGFEPLPELAKPGKELLNLISDLVKDKNTEFAVVSGRDHNTLGSWFAGIPVTLSAEHGYVHKDSGKDWHFTTELSDVWKPEAKGIMDNYVRLVPGSFIEDKLSSMCWHFRRAEVPVGENQTKLMDELASTVKKYGLSLLKGKELVEVRQSQVHKGDVVKRLLSDKPDFVLIAGDDVTDEDMFEAAPKTAFTIKIGDGDSAAKFRLKDHQDFLRLLGQLLS